MTFLGSKGRGVRIMVAKLLVAFLEPLYSNQGTVFSFNVLSSLLNCVPNDAFMELNQEMSGDSNGNLKSTFAGVCRYSR